MHNRREPTAKWMFAAWVLSGPLNLVVLISLIDYSFEADWVAQTLIGSPIILAISCALGMALAILHLPAGAATTGKVFSSVLTIALLVAVIAVVVLLVSVMIVGMNEPSSYAVGDASLKALLAAMTQLLPFGIFVSLVFAIPAAIYGALVLIIVGYEFRTAP